ncbi:MAG: small conductance mechanosensitive channel [Flavobacteriales bacterium]|jgi:small conductance mechanosensitive channel
MNIDIESLMETSVNFLLVYGVQILMALVIFVIGKWVVNQVTKIIEKAMKARGIDPTICQFIRNILYYLMLAFVIIAALGQLGVQTASIVAIMGAAGLAVGLALQGSLANFAAGVLMIAFRPCRVGDFVEVGGASGVVKEISIFSTILLTPDNKTVIISNANVMSGNIVNYSLENTRRVDLVIGVSYSANIAEVKNALQEILDSEEHVIRDKDATIAVSELASSSVNFAFRCWVNTADYWPAYFSLTEKVKLVFDQKGIEIPFDQMDVNLNYLEQAAN